MSTHYKNKRGFSLKGFTLLETLVSISILSISIAAAFGVAQSGLSSAIVARDQVIAFQLAQEAIESVKNIRDNNILTNATNESSSGWLTGLSQCLNVDCRLDTITPTIATCSGQDCNVFKDVQGFYVQSASGTPTPFTRKIRLETIVPDQEVKVSVTMSWSKGLLVRDFVVEEHIFNWQRGLQAL